MEKNVLKIVDNLEHSRMMFQHTYMSIGSVKAAEKKKEENNNCQVKKCKRSRVESH